MTPLIAAATGKVVRLFRKNGNLHHEYRRGSHRPDVDVVICGEGSGKKTFLRKKGSTDYLEVDFAEAPLPPL